MTLALLPIGILAAVLAADGIRSTREAELMDAEARFRATARMVDDLVAVDFLVLRALLRNDGEIGDNDFCSLEAANALDDSETFDAIVWTDMSGRTICESSGGVKPSAVDLVRLAAESGRENLLWPGGETMFFAVRDQNQAAARMVVVTVPVSRLRERLRHVLAQDRSVSVWLGSTPIVGDASPNPPPAVLTVRRTESAAGDQIIAAGPLLVAPFGLSIVTPASRLAAADLLAIAAPSLMWIAALLIGWLVVQRLVVRPLQDMASDVRAYGGGNDDVRLAVSAGRTDEMQAFAEAFDGMAKNIAEAKEDIAESLAEQRRLTREVHHRVKNNLQIVASLISIQSREAEGAEVARAYASIQMRVGALAVVHRWLYEDSDAGGVDIAALTHDLCASLQQILPSAKLVEARINTHLERLRVGPDAAVPLAFLITEIVALAARRTAARGERKLVIDIHLERSEDGGALRVCSDAFGDVDELSPSGTRAAARIVNGMARQLRGRIAFDSDTPCYEVHFPLPAKK